MKPINLKVEYFSNPLGVCVDSPRFSWELKSNKNNAFQTAYRIVVFEENNKAIVWDSGKVTSPNCVAINYGSTPLKEDTKYFWCVYAWDTKGKISKSSEAFFITGIKAESFKAEWISPQEDDIHQSETAPMIRKEFCVKDFKRATLYIYSCGFHYCFINGKKADDRVLSPAWSRMEKQLLCDVYDVTDKIVKGNNAIGVLLGDGYNENFSIYADRWADAKRFIMQLHIHNTDGTVDKIYSDSNWKCTFDSPVISNGIYDGECYDARNEQSGWSEIGFDDSNWHNARVINETKEKLVVEPANPIRITETLKPKKVYELENGRKIIDFGQNFAGFVKLKLRGKRGQKVTVRHAEELNKYYKKGKRVIELNTYTNRLAKAVDSYILKDENEAEYTPYFTYHGFRYIELIGVGADFSEDTVTACVIHASFSTAGTFKCDNRIVNRIFSNVLWSIKSNSMSYPTDCPVRDERTPCDMDVAAYEDMAVLCFDLSSYYSRWLNHIKIDLAKQKCNLKPCWSGNQVVLAWLLYETYADVNSLKAAYPSMKKYVENCLYYNPEFEFKNGFGDWCAPNENGDYLGAYSSVEETDMALFYNHLNIMAKAAKVLGKKLDEKKYSLLSEKCKQKYNEKFFESNFHTYSGGAQTPNILALKFGLVPENERAEVAKSLVKTITEKNNGHLNTGIFGSRYFVDVLAEMGETELAISCLTNKTFPGFGHQIALGATTLWEQWCYSGSMNSHNHVMFAGIATGFFTKLAGIEALDVGFKNISIKPHIPSSINKLECSYHTVYGDVVVKWQKQNGMLHLNATIPANCNATIVMPSGETYNVGNGKFKLTYKY